MKLLIELDEEYVKAIDNIKFLVGGRTDRKLQLEIIKAIKNGKTLDQEPRKGHWIPRNSFLLQYKCSECGFDSEKYNYCPNCGSRNEVEE